MLLTDKPENQLGMIPYSVVYTGLSKSPLPISHIGTASISGKLSVPGSKSQEFLPDEKVFALVAAKESTFFYFNKDRIEYFLWPLRTC